MGSNADATALFTDVSSNNAITFLCSVGRCWQNRIAQIVVGYTTNGCARICERNTWILIWSRSLEGAEVPDDSDVLVDSARRFAFMREETRFEIGLLHDRINALISVEAFLTISFTMAISNSSARLGATFATVIAAVLSLVGLVLAVFAWPGVDASFKIINEWSSRQRQFMRDNPVLTDVMWRPDVLGKGNLRADPDTRRTMFFARAVPAVFAIAWSILAITAFVLPLRR